MFSQDGVHITFKKGSAIFWYTRTNAGDVDEMAWHGSCPVIFGEKTGKTWLTNGSLMCTHSVAM